MQLRIKTHDLDLSPDMRQSLARGLRLSLGRHAGAIDQAQVILSPGFTVSGEEASRCEIRLRLSRGDRFTLADQGADPRSATARAARRLDQWLDRQRLRERLSSYA